MNFSFSLASHSAWTRCQAGSYEKHPTPNQLEVEVMCRWQGTMNHNAQQLVAALPFYQQHHVRVLKIVTVHRVSTRLRCTAPNFYTKLLFTQHPFWRLPDTLTFVQVEVQYRSNVFVSLL